MIEVERQTPVGPNSTTARPKATSFCIEQTKVSARRSP